MKEVCYIMERAFPPSRIATLWFPKIFYLQVYFVCFRMIREWTEYMRDFRIFFRYWNEFWLLKPGLRLLCFQNLMDYSLFIAIIPRSAEQEPPKKNSFNIVTLVSAFQKNLRLVFVGVLSVLILSLIDNLYFAILAVLPITATWFKCNCC